MKIITIFRILLVTGIALVIPFLAMQFGDALAWSGGDFLLAGILLFGAGCSYTFLTRNIQDTKKRARIGIVIAIILLVIWIQLAVGIF